eukprot:161028-Prorocentrum_minimum.AAC.1
MQQAWGNEGAHGCVIQRPSTGEHEITLGLQLFWVLSHLLEEGDAPWSAMHNDCGMRKLIYVSDTVAGLECHAEGGVTIKGCDSKA